MNKTLLIVIGILAALLTACLPLGMAAGCSSVKIESPVQPKTFEDWLNKTEYIGKYRDLTILKNLPKEKIIVVRNDLCDENIKKAEGKGFDGNYDRIQDVLTKLEIPHILIGKSEFDKDEYSLDDKWIIIFNCNFSRPHCCNPEHIKLPPNETQRSSQCPGTSVSKCQVHQTKLSDKTIQKIQIFVECGGYLFTEDLQIEEILEQAFKGYITHNMFLPERDATILPAREALKHPYLKNVFDLPNVLGYDITILRKPESKWKIEAESPNIKILNKSWVVTTLITSPDLVRSNKEGKIISDGTVAVTFILPTDSEKSPSVSGQVLHIMTHFGRQTSLTSEFSVQNLLVNFLEDCAKQHAE